MQGLLLVSKPDHILTRSRALVEILQSTVGGTHLAAQQRHIFTQSTYRADVFTFHGFVNMMPGSLGLRTSSAPVRTIAL